MGNKRNGFSDIETLVVLSILFILMALIAPVFTGQDRKNDKFEELSSEYHKGSRITIVRDKANGKKYILTGHGEHTSMAPYNE